MGLVDTKKELAKKGVLRGNESPKQVLVVLHQRDHLSRAALRILAKRLDEKIEEGLVDPLSSVLKAFDKGKVKLPQSVKEEETPPVLADAPANASPKQKIVWLFQHGAIDKATMREAAGHMDAASADGEKPDVAMALHMAGATHLLPEKVQAALKDDDAPPKPKEPKTDTANDGDGDEGGAPDPTADEQLAAMVYGSTVDEVKELVAGRDAVPELRRLKNIEEQNPSYEGGRSGVIDAIEERIGELETGEE